MIDLSGTVALVTGGSRGIGWAVSERLGQAGADVAIVYKQDVEAAEQAAVQKQREKYAAEVRLVRRHGPHPGGEGKVKRRGI